MVDIKSEYKLLMFLLKIGRSITEFIEFGFEKENTELIYEMKISANEVGDVENFEYLVFVL